MCAPTACDCARSCSDPSYCERCDLFVDLAGFHVAEVDEDHGGRVRVVVETVDEQGAVGAAESSLAATAGARYGWLRCPASGARSFDEATATLEKRGPDWGARTRTAAHVAAGPGRDNSLASP